MFNGNPNRPARPYQPRQFQMAPTQRDQNNPFKFGQQRVAGQTAFQPNRYGLGGGTNTRPQSLSFQNLPAQQSRPTAQDLMARLQGYSTGAARPSTATTPRARVYNDPPSFAVMNPGWSWNGGWSQTASVDPVRRLRGY